MKIQLPKNVKYIIDKLYDAGFEAYAVGGCVRDSLMGVEPKDWDITTNALPEDVKKIFSHTIDTGIKHGTVSVLLDKVIYEITTYRIDGEYKDHRHPETVTYSRVLKEDLLRRDFTINAMAYNDKEGLVDEFGGQEDLKKGIIRCVGVPKDRFTEDALRIMRASRFAAVLGFDIDEGTCEAMKELSGNLKFISAERIQAELIKTITSGNPAELIRMYELGITKVILPIWDEMMECEQHNPNHMYTVGMHTIKAMEGVHNDKILRLTMLFHDSAKPECKTTDGDGVDHFKGHPAKSAENVKRILRELKMDNDTIDKVSTLVSIHDTRVEASPKAFRRFMNKVGEKAFPYFFEVQRADIMAQSDYRREEKLALVDAYENVYNEIIKAKDCFTLKDLAVNGRDLIEKGINPGPDFKRILDEMLSDVIDNPEHNDKSYLMSTYVK